MPLDFPNLVYVSGDHDVAEAVTLPRFSAPLTGVNVDYLLTQEFQVDLNSYAKITLNTPHPNFPDFVLVAESDIQDVGGGDVRWTRTYAKVPDDYTEISGTLAYNFIGFAGYTQTASTATNPLTGRPRFSKTVPVQVTHEFFLIGPGQPYATSEEIPTIEGQQYLMAGTDYYLDFLADDPPYGWQSDPGQAEYQALMAADGTDQESYSLVPETCAAQRWLGNIFMRATRRIKAL